MGFGALFSVGSNGTVSAPFSRIDVTSDATLKIVNARSATFAELRFSGGTFVYGFSFKAMNLTRSLEMGGAFVLVLPVSFSTRKQRTVVEVWIAKFVCARLIVVVLAFADVSSGNVPSE